MQEQKKNILDFEILKRLFGFIRPYRLLFWTVVFLICLLAILSPLLPILIQKTIDGPISEGNSEKLLWALVGMIALLFINSIVAFFNTYLSGLLSQNIIHDIRNQVFSKIIRLRLQYYDQTAIGKMVTRTISDVESLSEVFSSGFAAIIGDALQILLILIVMFSLHWQLTLISISTIPILMICTYIFKEKIKKSFNIVRNSVANLNAFVQEHLSGISLVQIFNVEKAEYQKFLKLNKTHRDANIKSILYYSIYYPVADVIAALGVGLIVWYGSKGMIHDEISLGTITAFIMFTNQFFRPIRMIADRVNTLQMGVVSISRIIEIIDEKENIENEGSETIIIEGKVSFKNVFFAYNENQPILKNISFEVQKGNSLALVGATGAGKTSIISLINRFYDIQKGEILIDGHDIKKFTLKSLRSQVGVVLQDVFLFSGSIADNLRLDDFTIEDEKIVQAAKLVGVHEFICQLPGEYQYQVKERGATLSVGQRQLLAFVRVVLHNPKILILDEATSSVDSESEMLIQNAIEKLIVGRTTLIIAHRLSTIKKANEIIVLEKGEIVEQGNHQALLALGKYYFQLNNSSNILH